MYAYAHNTTPLYQPEHSPNEIVFHTRPCTPLTFSLNLIRNSSKECIATNGDSLQPHTKHNEKSLNHSFTRSLRNTFRHGFYQLKKQC